MISSSIHPSVPPVLLLLLLLLLQPLLILLMMLLLMLLMHLHGFTPLRRVCRLFCMSGCMHELLPFARRRVRQCERQGGGRGWRRW